jgi:glucosylceramidase
LVLHWVNPSAADLASIIVRISPGSTPPMTVTDGGPVSLATPLAQTVAISGLIPNSRYAVSVFARDSSSNVSPPMSLTLATRPVVQSWLTTADATQRLARQADAGAVAGSSPLAGPVIDLFPAEQLQHFQGAGAALTESAASLLTALPATARAEAMQRLFGVGPQSIRLSYLRVSAGASDFALSSYSYNDIPLGSTDPQARGINPALRIMGTPWSAPAWMKSSGSLNGGTLLPQWRAAYADYLVRYQQAYAASGAALSSLSVVNEPLRETTSYPSMAMTASDQAEFIGDFLAPAMSSAGLATDVLIYDHNWDDIRFPQTVLADQAAAAAASGTAFHCYAGNALAQSEMHAAAPGKSVLMTECSGGGWETSYARNLAWNMRNLVVGNFRNWGEALLLWNLALDPSSGPQNGGCQNCRGVVTVDRATAEVSYNVEFDVLGHVTKFVQPGARRISSTAYGPGGPENVAFRNPDGSLVLIVYSDRASNFTVRWGADAVPYTLAAGSAATLVVPAPKAAGLSVEARAPGGLQAFEAAGAAFPVHQVDVGPSSQGWAGSRSLKATGTGGPWHTVGIYPAGGPADLRTVDRLCLRVNDQTGTSGNTLAVKLVDIHGVRQEVWSDDAAAGLNSLTSSGEWVKLCWQTSAFAVDLARVDHLQLTWYWPGAMLVDDVSLE